MREPSAVIPVTAVVDDDGLVHIEGDDLFLVRWNHRPALVRAALQRFGGRADWKPRWNLLAVPTEAFMGSARSVFSLAVPGKKSECSVTRTTNPDHLLPGVPSPTNLPPLRIARPVLIGETRAQGEPARLTVDRNFVLRWALRRRDDVGFRVTERELPTYPPGTIPRSAGRSGGLGGGPRAGPALGQPAGSNTQVELAVHRLECSRRC